MNLDTLLKQKRPVITDGAMGTYFTQKTGFSIHECEWANISRPELISEIGRNARLDYEQKYRPEDNYKQLLDIDRRTMEQ